MPEIKRTVLYWRQYLWAKGYFVEMSEQVSAMDVQKYIEEQEAHHRHDHFKVSEF
ncbi:MAG: transposase [Alphaproteobacteria bacterium]|nr:transposase [Alphaproteobacteria bacterium]